MAASDPTFGVATPTGVLEGVAAFGWDGSQWQPSGRAAYGVGTPTGVLRGVAPFSWSGSAWTPAGQAGPGVATPSGVLQGVAVYTWNGSAWTPAGGGPSSSTPTGALRGVAAFTWDGAAWQPAAQAGPDVATPFGVLQGVAMFNWTGAAWIPSAGIPAGATLSLNFLTPGTLDPLLTFTRASTGTYFDSGGVMRTAAINAPRWDYDPVSLQLRGLLLEESRTNGITNSVNMSAVVPGTPGTLPANWGIGSGAVGLTRSVIGTGVENGIAYVDARLFGTATATTAFNITCEGNTAITAANGQAWACSMYWRVAGGSLNGITTSLITVRELTSAGATVRDNNVTVANPSAAALSTQRAVASATLTGGGTVARVNALFQIGVTIGAAIDITVRYGAPQIEQGAFPTSFVPTTSVAVQRVIDTALYSAAPLDPNTGSLLAEFYLPQIQGASANVEIVSMDQGAVTDIMSIRQMGAGFFGASTVFVANANVGSFTATSLSVGINKVAMTYARGAPNAVTVAANGAAVTSGAPTGLPTPTRLTFGSGRNTMLGGHIRRVTYWPRVLSNTEMQQVTT